MMRYRLLLFVILFLSSCTPPGYIRTQKLVFYEDKREEIVSTAKKYIGSRYKNGGNTPDGFDCSGFTYYVYRENELNIPRKASAQYYSGRKIRLQSAKPGDLVFFTINSNRISHVGIYMGDSGFIHSPSKGKGVSFSSIKNKYWKRRYTGTVTYFAEKPD